MPAASPPAPAHETTRTAWLQLEDVALALVLGLVEPALGRWLGDAPLGIRFGELDAAAPGARLATFLLLAAGLGAAACLVTRPRGEAARDPFETLRSLAGYARFPLMVFVGVLLAMGLEGLGVRTGEGFLFAVVIVLGAPLAFYPRLPELVVGARRALMAPAVVLGTLMFGELADGLLGGGSLPGALPARDDPIFGFALFVVSLLVAGVLAFYMLLVVAPRKVAGEPGGWLAWGARFALFLAALAFGLAVPF